MPIKNGVMVRGMCLQKTNHCYGNVPSNAESRLGQSAHSKRESCLWECVHQKESGGSVNVPSKIESGFVECAFKKRARVMGMCLHIQSHG